MWARAGRLGGGGRLRPARVAWAKFSRPAPPVGRLKPSVHHRLMLNSLSRINLFPSWLSLLSLLRSSRASVLIIARKR